MYGLQVEKDLDLTFGRIAVLWIPFAVFPLRILFDSIIFFYVKPSLDFENSVIWGSRALYLFSVL